MNFVKAINEINSNVWAIVIIIGGIVLSCCKQPVNGTALLGIGATLLRGFNTSSQVQQTATLAPVGTK